MKIDWLGRINYQTALRIQEERLENCLNHGEESVVLLEHDPVYTIGRLPDKSSLRVVARLPYPVFETNRGGQATYHGPGQLVGYPILDLRPRGRDLHCYLRKLEDLLIDLLNEFGIKGAKVEGKTGVWVEDRKIASIGVGVRKWVTMHGFALNVASDLSGFSSIIPCGLCEVKMTSVSMESANEISLETVCEKISPYLHRYLDVELFAAGSAAAVLPPQSGNVA
ncbi:MAG: lipoyl(octanoyl) transferase LipB [Verrucomicrobia bacterium]|nr:lipoyl(octanoyl) transferase LipB [Verrucomicrobiota bacterium]